MKRLFILAIYTTCALFSAENVLVADMSVQRSVVIERNTAVEFDRFVEGMQRYAFSNKVCSNIAAQLIRFCRFEGHYVEANPDLVNQKAYFEILLNDYSPLFLALQALDRSSANANAFFDCVLDVYTRNLRDQVNLARMNCDDDLKFANPEKSPIWYEAPGLDFFRSPGHLLNYERFIIRKKIKGITLKHSLFLKEKQQELLRRKETQTEYRQCAEDYLNQLLHMAWMAVSDRASLSNKTKALLCSLPYIHKILKHGNQGQSFNYDLLIIDSLNNPENQLHNVFRIIEASCFFVSEIPLPEILLPNKKRKKKPSAASTQVLPKTFAQGDHDLEEDDIDATEDRALTSSVPTQASLDKASLPSSGSVEKVEGGAVEEFDKSIPEILSEETKESKRSSLAVHTGLVEAFQPMLYELNDWQNGRPIILRYDLCQLTKDRSKAAKLLESLRELNESKFVCYGQVTSIYIQFKGVIVNKKGSHETWVFDSNGDKVKTTFFFLHGKDQYGPWTKLDVQQVIQDVLRPFLVKESV